MNYLSKIKSSATDPRDLPIRLAFVDKDYSRYTLFPILFKFSKVFLNLENKISRHLKINSKPSKYPVPKIANSIVNLLCCGIDRFVRLDDEFSPIIEQNGYETEVDNLSGGEKTSLALSYRLSLNRIINSMISTIKTKDIIILDEPTDGFSTDQLDRVREVLDQLENKQVIIVSHENKIESFVQNIIRINKEEHISKVVSA